MFFYSLNEVEFKNSIIKNISTVNNGGLAFVRTD